MNDRREFVFMCEHMGGTTWTVEHQWAIEGEAEEVVRCKNCKRATIDQGDHDYREPLWCGLLRIDVRPEGFCHMGVRRDA